MAGLTRDEARQVLARHGIDVASGDGDLDRLETLAAAHGWLTSVERVGTTRGTARYHAMVWDPVRVNSPTPTTLAAQRQGKTAAAALGLTLATMLARQERSAQEDP